MSNYAFLPGAPFTGDATEVQAELERIRSVGELTPEAVVFAAKSKRSILHSYIYDGTTPDEALERYHIDRARVLIKAIVVVRDDVPTTIRANIRISTESGRAWESVELPEAREIERARLTRELGRLRLRLRDLDMYPAVVEAIEEVLAA